MPNPHTLIVLGHRADQIRFSGCVTAYASRKSVRSMPSSIPKLAATEQQARNRLSWQSDDGAISH